MIYTLACSVLNPESTVCSHMGQIIQTFPDPHAHQGRRCLTAALLLNCSECIPFTVTCSQAKSLLLKEPETTPPTTECPANGLLTEKRHAEVSKWIELPEKEERTCTF